MLIAVAAVVVVLLGVGVGALLLTRDGADAPAGFREISTPHLTYAVPDDWADGSSSDSPPEVLGVPFSGIAEAPGYDCGGNRYLRGIVGSALVDRPAPPRAVAEAVARDLGAAFYSTADGPGRVRISDSTDTAVGGARGVLVRANITAPADDGCLATDGVLLVLAVPAGGGEIAVLVVNGDVTGGPDTPPSPDAATLQAIVDSARLPAV